MTKRLINLKTQVLSFGLWLLAACSGDSPNIPASQPIRLTTGADVSVETTRGAVIGVLLPKDDRVGVFAYSYTGTDGDWDDNPDIWENEPATVGDADGGARSPLTIADALYTSDKHAFYAYYPFISGITAADPLIEGDLFATATANAADGQIDWMWSDPVTGQTATANPVRLVFRHKLTLLPILTAKTRDVDVELRLEEITFETNTSQAFTFNVATGDMQAGDDGETTYTIAPADSVATIPDIEDDPALDPEDETLATEVMDYLLLLPETRITAIGLKVNGELYATPAGWAGFETAKAGEFRLLSIVMGISEITISIGGKNWDDGDTTDFTHSELRIALGDRGWVDNSADDIDLINNPVVISIGKQGWKENNESIKINYK